MTTTDVTLANYTQAQFSDKPGCLSREAAEKLMVSGKLRARFNSARGGLLLHAGDLAKHQQTIAAAHSARMSEAGLNFEGRREFSARMLFGGGVRLIDACDLALRPLRSTRTA